MLDRRDLLKFFGAGAVVVPIIGAAPLFDAKARIVRPGELEPLADASVPDLASSLVRFGLPRDPYRMNVEFRRADGSLAYRRFSADTFVTSLEYHHDPLLYSDPELRVFSDAAVKPSGWISWKMTGAGFSG